MSSPPIADSASELRRRVRQTLRKQQLQPIEDAVHRTPRKSHVLVIDWNVDPTAPGELCLHLRAQFRAKNINAYVLADLQPLFPANRSKREATVKNIARTANAVVVICSHESVSVGPSSTCDTIVTDLFPLSAESPPTDRRMRFYVHDDVDGLPADQVEPPLGSAHPTFGSRKELVKNAGRDVMAILPNPASLPDPPGSSRGLATPD